MPSRRGFLKSAALVAGLGGLPQIGEGSDLALSSVKSSTSAKQWLHYLKLIVEPVLQAQADGMLAEKMPVESKTPADAKNRAQLSPLEAFARTAVGISGLLNYAGSDRLLIEARDRYKNLFILGLKYAVDPNHKGYLFKQPQSAQTLVEVAFLSLFFHQCPHLLPKGDTLTQWEACRLQGLKHKPYPNNWLLFSALTLLTPPKSPIAEPELIQAEEYLSQFLALYAGDGWYKDGPEFHLDYYNSFVIHPFLLVISSLGLKYPSLNQIKGFDKINRRAARHAIQLERLIGSEGYMPAIGRSCTYRSGILHLLAGIASLPENHPVFIYLPKDFPATIRESVFKAIQAFFKPKNTFSAQGWLQPGMYGYQPDMCETYISTGSLYLASFAFLPLNGTNSQFWQKSEVKTTAEKLILGLDLPNDQAYKE